MSVKLKQRFGEVLALALIVTIVGFIVYLLIPTSPKTLTSTPVTVRSTTKVETQSHVATVTNQTAPSGHVLQETVAENVNHNSPSAAISAPNSTLAPKKETQQQSNNAQSVVAASTAKVVCTPLSKVVAKVGAALQSIPVVGDLVPNATNCNT